MAPAKLTALIFCQPQAKRFSGEPLVDALALPEIISASRTLNDEELSHQFASPYHRPADVPLAFHRESPGMITYHRANHEMALMLETYGRMIQYQFSDGLILTGHQVLYHPYSRNISRHLLPLNVNTNSKLLGRSPFSVEIDAPLGQRTSWQLQAEQVILSMLLATIRAARQAHFAALEGDEDAQPLSLFLTLSDAANSDRPALRIENVELGDEGWGPWRLTTALPAPHSGVFYGRARVELDPHELGDLKGLSRSFLVDAKERRLLFHTFKDQIHRLQTHAAKQAALPTEEPHPLQPLPHESAALETGISLHLAGHANIQAAKDEVQSLLADDGHPLPVFPGTHIVEANKVRARISLTSDGSLRFLAHLDAPGGPWEAHGLPQGFAYLLLNLQFGLGGTTGYSNSQIAHSRRGLKRERDMKILRNLGYSQLIFLEAANFAFGLPLTDGTKVNSVEELTRTLFERLGSLILKSEGWPVQAGSLMDLCSKNVTTLIEGFIQQVVRDVEGRPVHLYLPQGELRVEGLSTAVVRLYHALVLDLAQATQGACFTRARTKYFDNFMNGRERVDRVDLAVRIDTDPVTSQRLIYQPGIGERYLVPETSIPPAGNNLFSLINHGFEVVIDGKPLEEFEVTDFRPEFTLNEEPENIPNDTRKIDWFELHPKFFFKGVEISSEQATRLSKEGMIEFQGRLYRVRAKDLPSMRKLTRFWSTIQGQGAGLIRSKRRKTEDTYYQLPRSQTLELLALRASGVQVHGGPRWEAVCKFYDSLGEPRAPLKLPESFKAELQPYQVTGVQWIRDLFHLGLGGILADDMGLGKTVTSLAFLESLRAEDQMGSVLVLVPTSLTYNWLSEAERFAPELPITIFQSRTPEAVLDFVQARPHAVVVCTYGLLQEHSELLQQVRWNTVIFDEAQNLKNLSTKRTTAARKLSAGFKLCLTGTPLENHYGEFYSLFDLVVPSSLGDLPSFRETYVNPPRVLREDLDYLRLKTKPLLLRRTKAQVMHQLPPKVETTIKLPFEEQQKRIYRDIAASYNEQIRNAIAEQGEAKSQLQMLTALLRLRQACSDPSAIPGVEYTEEPPKVTTLLEALRDVTESGESALVFTQFLATYERIRRAMTAAQIPFSDINGADSRLSREKKLRSFMESDQGSVMLMTLKTGGVGLNLTKASYIFHVEPWWNPAVENQATDRAHRIGQSKTVQVYRYLIRESVEEKIEILKDLKSKRFDALFSNSEGEPDLGSGSSTLSQQDFEYLLS